MFAKSARARSTLLGLLFASLLALLLAGCWNQQRQGEARAQADRQIELVIRSQYDVPADYGVAFGRARASNVSGYDELPVVFSHGDKHVDFAFLLSHDRRWLARLQRFDLHDDFARSIEIAGRPILGNPEARVTIVVYDDLQCPFCARLHERIPQTIDRYKGLVRVVYKDYPLIEIHDWATHAAVNANCLAKQDPGEYWKYIDFVHAHHEELGARRKDSEGAFRKLDELALAYGSTRGLAPRELSDCISAQNDTNIKQSVEEAGKLNIQSTPTIYINGERIVGLRPNEWLWAAIDRALAASNQPSIARR
jgi:protein-disulfide isomerase